MKRKCSNESIYNNYNNKSIYGKILFVWKQITVKELNNLK